MLQQFSDLAKPALNKCSLSLGDGTDQPIRKKNLKAQGDKKPA